MSIQNLIIATSTTKKVNQTKFEVIERKGIGHPDTLCDVIAEKISQKYSQYCLEHYGIVLRHMVDKIALSGGSTKVTFGGGDFKKPIRLYLNCRFTRTFQGEAVPYLDIATRVIHTHFNKILPLLDVKKHLTIVDNTHFTPGPGVVYGSDDITNNEREFFFDVPDGTYAKLHNNSMRSNDTSTSVAYYPLSMAEKMVIFVEETLNNHSFKKVHPYIGTDIKVMAKRIDRHVDLTICIPFISKHTPSEVFYFEHINLIKNLLTKLLEKEFPKYTSDIWVNTRDNPEKSDFYLTLIGSAIESGDEGVVGRGNRYNGVIPFNRHMTMEACCGKNPIYHVGKLYTAIASLISQEINDVLNIETYVYLTSQMGRKLSDPWSIYIEATAHQVTQKEHDIITDIIQKNLSNIEETSLKIIYGELNLF